MPTKCKKETSTSLIPCPHVNYKVQVVIMLHNASWLVLILTNDQIIVTLHS